MRTPVISLIYKKKGDRTSWENYRPISVGAAEYKIMTKAIQLAVADVIHHVVSPQQYGFQQGKYIGEAIALASLTASSTALPTPANPCHSASTFVTPGSHCPTHSLLSHPATHTTMPHPALPLPPAPTAPSSRESAERCGTAHR